MVVDRERVGYLPTLISDPTILPQSINDILDKVLGCRGTVTLTPSATSTTVTDEFITDDCLPTLMALTTSAASAPVRVTSVTRGSFTIEHDSDAATDRNFHWKGY